MSDINAGIDDGNLHARARVARAHHAPGLGHLVQRQRVVEQKMKRAHGMNMHHARHTRQSRRLCVGHADHQRIGYRVDAIHNRGALAFQRRPCRAVLRLNTRAMLYRSLRPQPALAEGTDMFRDRLGGKLDNVAARNHRRV